MRPNPQYTEGGKQKQIQLSYQCLQLVAKNIEPLKSKKGMSNQDNIIQKLEEKKFSHHNNSSCTFLFLIFYICKLLQYGKCQWHQRAGSWESTYCINVLALPLSTIWVASINMRSLSLSYHSVLGETIAYRTTFS